MDVSYICWNCILGSFFLDSWAECLSNYGLVIENYMEAFPPVFVTKNSTYSNYHNT